jgi:hypothetical protein
VLDDGHAVDDGIPDATEFVKERERRHNMHVHSGFYRVCSQEVPCQLTSGNVLHVDSYELGLPLW